MHLKSNSTPLPESNPAHIFGLKHMQIRRSLLDQRGEGLGMVCTVTDMLRACSVAAEVHTQTASKLNWLRGGSF